MTTKKKAPKKKAEKAVKAVPAPTPKLTASEASFSLDVKAHGL